MQVVEVEGVLGSFPASGHAAAAEGASGALRAASPEVGVGHPLARFAEMDPDVGRREPLVDPRLGHHGAQHLVPLVQAGVGRHAEHPPRGLIMGRELGVPVGQMGPRVGLEERPGRFLQHCGVDQ